MQFSNLFLVATLTAGTFASPFLKPRALHTKAICVGRVPQVPDDQVMLTEVTRKACNDYLAFNIGPAQHESCADCFYNESEPRKPFCESKGNHIGGDEFSDFCKKNGAEGSQAN